MSQKSLPAKTSANKGGSLTLTGLTEREEQFCMLSTTYGEYGMLPSIRDVYLFVYQGVTDPMQVPSGVRAEATRSAEALLKRPAVADRAAQLLAESQEAMRSRVFSQGIALVENRVARKNEDWIALQRIKEQRRETSALLRERIADIQSKINQCEDEDEKLGYEIRLDKLVTLLAEVPGMDTGLMTSITRVGKDGELSRSVFFDKKLLDAQLELEESVAKELGQHKTVVNLNVHAKAYAGFDPGAV